MANAILIKRTAKGAAKRSSLRSSRREHAIFFEKTDDGSGCWTWRRWRNAHRAKGTRRRAVQWLAVVAEEAGHRLNRALHAERREEESRGLAVTPSTLRVRPRARGVECFSRLAWIFSACLCAVGFASACAFAGDCSGFHPFTCFEALVDG